MKFSHFGFYTKLPFWTNSQDKDETSLTSESQMPSVMCPVCACILYWPLGIGALIYYMRAGTAKGNRF